MTTWNVTLTVTLARPIGLEVAQALGQPLTGRHVLASLDHDAHQFSLVRAVDSDSPPGEVARQAAEELADVCARSSVEIAGWEAVAVLSQAETDRRLQLATIPPMVSVEEAARMCGVKTQRMYELETERRKAEVEGREHPLPGPVVPGYYLRTAMQRYAETRRRRPGRPPKAS